MIRHFLFLSATALAFFAPPARCQDKAQSPVEIRLPVIDVPNPMPTSPVAVTKLAPNQLYVIDSDTELSVVASRDGYVSITPEAGPLKIRGVFVDDTTGRAKTKTFKGTYLYVVEAVQTGTVELILFKDIKTAPIRRTIDVEAGQAPQPPPGPGPKPDNNPPIPGPGVKVMIVYDPKVNLPESQNQILFGQPTRTVLESTCIAESDKRKAYRIWPAGEQSGGESKQWQDAYTRASKGPFPFVIVSDGKGSVNSFEGALPSTVEAFQKLIEKVSK